MASAMDSVDHFHNGIFDKCRRYSVMLDCCSNQTYLGKIQLKLILKKEKKTARERVQFTQKNGA